MQNAFSSQAETRSCAPRAITVGRTSPCLRDVRKSGSSSLIGGRGAGDEPSATPNRCAAFSPPRLFARTKRACLNGRPTAELFLILTRLESKGRVKA